MIVSERVYHAILDRLSPAGHEAGGILGGNGGVVRQFIPDEGQTRSSERYVPDVLFMNRKIDEWRQNGIVFYGIVHNHLTHAKQLSGEDVRYIKKIMDAMPAHMDRLYFPLVLPDRRMAAFTARRKNGNISLVEDALQIV